MRSPFIRSSCLSSITTLELLGMLERDTKDAITFRRYINLQTGLCAFGDTTNTDNLNILLTKKVLLWSLCSGKWHIPKK